MPAVDQLTMKLEYVALDKISVPSGNPRKHTSAQIALIAASMAAHGNINPLLVDERLVLIAGEARLEAAKLSGHPRVPVIRLRHLTPAQRRLYRIADNRLAELGKWSIPELVTEFASIEIEMPSLDFQLSGFTLDAIDQFRDQAVTAADPEDELAEPISHEAVTTRLGDIWGIGDHRLICGDATSAETHQQLLGRERPSMVFADPPYNVPIAGNVSGLGKARHREFVQASGEMSDADFRQFLLNFMLLSARFAKAGALHYICMDWRHLHHLLSAGLVAGAAEPLAMTKTVVLHKQSYRLGRAAAPTTDCWFSFVAVQSP